MAYIRSILVAVSIRVEGDNAIDVDKFESSLREALVQVANQKSRARGHKVRVLVPATRANTYL